MDNNQVIMHELLELAFRLDVTVRREMLGNEDEPVQSGLAWVDHRPILFLDSRLSPPEAVGILVQELAAFSLEDVYIKPGIRALFDPYPEDDATPE